MNIYYINLDSATERRAAIESNFSRFAADFNVVRVPAISADQVNADQVTGSLQSREKACFLSHLKAIEMSCEEDGPSLIVEDDVIFGTRTSEYLRYLAQHVALNTDIIFTELGITNSSSMLKSYRHLCSHSDVGLVQTRSISFAGMIAYILNRESKRKIIDISKLYKTLDIPFDLLIKQRIMDGELTSSFTFPFITSTSAHSLTSQIQSDQAKLTDQTLDLFRKLAFLEWEQFHPGLLEQAEKLAPFNFPDQRSKIFAALWARIPSISIV